MASGRVDPELPSSEPSQSLILGRVYPPLTPPMLKYSPSSSQVTPYHSISNHFISFQILTDLFKSFHILGSLFKSFQVSIIILILSDLFWSPLGTLHTLFGAHWSSSQAFWSLRGLLGALLESLWGPRGGLASPDPRCLDPGGFSRTPFGAPRRPSWPQNAIPDRRWFGTIAPISWFL